MNGMPYYENCSSGYGVLSFLLAILQRHYALSPF